MQRSECLINPTNVAVIRSKNRHYKVINCYEYSNGLRRRGDITIWFTEAANAEWSPTRTGARCRPQEYSNLTIVTALITRQVFHLPLRQTAGFMNSLAGIMKVDITIPDFSSLSKRSIKLPQHTLTKEMEPSSLVIIDSTGLKDYGKDEWHQEKHGAPARRTWWKLHLAVDENHQLLAYELTTPEVGDPTAVPDLLAQIDTPFDTFNADGAYDGEPISPAVLNQQPDAQVIIPPHENPVRSATSDSQRDGHIRVIEQHGRIAWQKKTGYGLLNYAELTVQRYKRILGNAMKARTLPQQKTEAWIGASALNRMANLGIPVSVKF